jgi:hypothetical protein
MYDLLIKARGLTLAMFVLVLANGARPVFAEPEEINYEEDKVGEYVLPDPLVMRDGRAVTSAAMWRDERRPELLELFQTQVYGRRIPKPEGLRFEVAVENLKTLAGKALRKLVRIDLAGRDEAKWPGIRLTLILPANAKGPVPAFVGMHLFDTQAESPLPGKLLEGDVGEKLPGERLLEVILERGYAIGTLDAKDFCPDDKERFREGLLAQLYPERMGSPDAEEGGAIATWAWGLSRALDYLETDPAVDAKRVAVIGHSRMGKTALWAGAQDERFALVISNNSGCGGAALSRRIYGETVARINHTFPHWFCGNFKNYDGRENELPVDQHELIALVAPRPVYVASAQEDRWADPRGEFLAAAGADPVYKLLEKPGLELSELPEVGKSLGTTIGYHRRVGKHALTDYDWLRYLDFADRYLGQPSAASSAPK